jgi:hypothetical protein
MDFPASPIRESLAALLLLGGGLAAVRGTRRLLRGLGQAVSLDVVLGLRGWAIALAAEACAIGLLSAESGFLVLGGIVLAEELYETGLVALVIRAGERRASEHGGAVRQ